MSKRSKQTAPAPAPEKVSDVRAPAQGAIVDVEKATLLRSSCVNVQNVCLFVCDTAHQFTQGAKVCRMRTDERDPRFTLNPFTTTIEPAYAGSDADNPCGYVFHRAIGAEDIATGNVIMKGASGKANALKFCDSRFASYMVGQGEHGTLHVFASMELIVESFGEMVQELTPYNQTVRTLHDVLHGAKGDLEKINSAATSSAISDLRSLAKKSGKNPRISQRFAILLPVYVSEIADSGASLEQWKTVSEIVSSATISSTVKEDTLKAITSIVEDRLNETVDSDLANQGA